MTTQPRRQADAVVIGGGPAGRALSTLLAKAGRSVIQFERETFPREHIGEGLIPSAVPVLEALGPELNIQLPSKFAQNGAKIDDAIYVSRLNEARARLQVAQAKQALAEGKLKQTAADYQRAQAIVKSAGISQAELDTAKAGESIA